MSQKRIKLPTDTFNRHLRVRSFDMPEIYNDKPDFETPDRLLLCRLYIDSYRALNRLEFLTFQTLLVLQDSWDSRPEDPTEFQTGEFSTHDPMYLSLEIVQRALDTDWEKFVAVIRSCLCKLPVLEALVDPFLLKEIKEVESDLKYIPSPVDIDYFHYVGKLLKSGTKRMKKGKVLIDTTDKEGNDQ